MTGLSAEGAFGSVFGIEGSCTMGVSTVGYEALAGGFCNAQQEASEGCEFF